MDEKDQRSGLCRVLGLEAGADWPDIYVEIGRLQERAKGKGGNNTVSPSYGDPGFTLTSSSGGTGWPLNSER